MKAMRMRKWGKLFLILLMGLMLFSPVSGSAAQKVGVLFVVHGGFEYYQQQYLWDTSVQMFSYEPNHSVYQLVIWCPEQWKNVLTTQNGPKEVAKYAFEYDRIGGKDPFSTISMQQMADMVSEMSRYSCDNVTFVYDYAQWMSGDDINHYIYPRFIYNGPPAWEGVGCTTHTNCIYCGEQETGGPWPGCDPNRYNVDGPIDRLLAQGVSQIVLVDLTVGGVRFTKTYDVLTMAKRALSDNGAGSVPITWLNDPNNLMVNSKPDNPVGWTPQWSYVNGPPTHDPSVPLSSNPNPIASDPDLITLNVDAIEASMSPSVPASQTGVLLLNHALVDWAEYFDPKINDTITINEGIKAALIAKGVGANNILGAYMGIKENGSAEGGPATGSEYTRRMRGENLGYAWLYQSSKQLPAVPWGYKYWDALEILKNNGVQHIVIGFPQIISDSVLNLVEIPTQIGKEIGIKTWAKWGTFDYATYPGIGHPFPDYWGIWVRTQCKKIPPSGTETEPCCFTMGGCGGSQPYPPQRQTTGARAERDPSLAYDLSDYGHLGYDPAFGATNPNFPVQNQYAGTWEMYQPASARPEVGQMLAKHILGEFTCSINPTVVNRADFKAIGSNRKVTVIWTTAAEIDNAGFNIYRSTEENGVYAKINAELISAKGSPSTSATYQFIDKPVKNRTTYWYKLEDIDLKGEATMHGPVSARPNLLKFFKKQNTGL